MKFSLLSLNIAKIGEMTLASGKKVASAFDKKPVCSAFLNETGFTGDQQADLQCHGGADKAICVYSAHNRQYFEDELGLQISLPAFGENFSVDYAPENELFIGDVFICGEIKLQISQPRQPCFKAGLYHGNNRLIKLMQESGKTGFYFRVLSGGELDTSAEFSRPESDGQFSLSLANEIMYKQNKDEALRQQLIDHPALSAAWKAELSGK